MAMSQNYTAIVQVKVSDVQLKSQINNIKLKPLTLKLRTDTKDTQAQLNSTTSGAKNLQTQMESTSTQATKMGSSINGASTQVKDLGKDFLTTMGKVAKFAAVTAILGAFTGAITQSIQVVKEFDDALTDFKKVSDLSGESLDSYTQKLGELGEATARTTTEMVSASTEFKKSGFSDEDSAQLASIATLYQNVADSELSASDASSFVISQMKAFNITADNAITIIDKVNEVSNNFAVSSTDVSSALTKTSSSLSAYGNTMDETIGLVTAGTEIMTGQAGKVGRGLRSIGANIAKLANETGTLTYQVNGATKTISLFDETTGDMKSTFEVLSEVSQDWDKMSTAEQSALAIAQAGKQGSCSYRLKCWELLKSLILNYNSNIISGKFNKFGIVII